jgi:hypothetical protein
MAEIPSFEPSRKENTPLVSLQDLAKGIISD